jgi:hypothetical protein
MIGTITEIDIEIDPLLAENKCVLCNEMTSNEVTKLICSCKFIAFEGYLCTRALSNKLHTLIKIISDKGLWIEHSC